MATIYTPSPSLSFVIMDCIYNRTYHVLTIVEDARCEIGHCVLSVSTSFGKRWGGTVVNIWIIMMNHCICLGTAL